MSIGTFNPSQQNVLGLPVQVQPSNKTGTYNVNLSVNADQYMAQGSDLALKAAPHVPAAIAGYKAKEGIVDGLRSARRVRNASYRARAYGGRYSSSRSYRGKSAVGTGGGRMFSGITSAVKSSVIWGGLLSLAFNGYKVYKKEQTVSAAGTYIAGDVASAVVGGAAGAALSAVGTPILAGMLGPASILVTVGGIGLGIAGYYVADKFFRNTSLFASIHNGAYNLFSKVFGA
jgi:hypothetical protein